MILFDGLNVQALGQCQVELAGEKFDFDILSTHSLSLLFEDTCLGLGLLSIKQE